jgi:hypothetical protein
VLLTDYSFREGRSGDEAADTVPDFRPAVQCRHAVSAGTATVGSAMFLFGFEFIHFFVCGLFNDTVSSSGRIIYE